MSRILWVDAAFEAVLACGCAAMAVRLVDAGTGRVPSWLGPGVLWGAAVALAGVGVGLGWLSSRADRDALRVVAVGNAVTAVLAAAWATLGLTAGPFSATVVLIAVGLAALAAAQWLVARRAITSDQRGGQHVSPRTGPGS